MQAILVGLGLQHKSVEELEKELQLPPNQLLAMFNKIVKKVIALLEQVSVNEVNRLLFADKTAAAAAAATASASNGKAVTESNKMAPLAQSLEDELNEAASRVKRDEQQHKKELLADFDLKQYEIKGNESEWSDALKLPTTSSYVTIKRYETSKSEL